ncbi:MAG: NF038122 family metalloprotease [Bryobacterales bacterium]|nr:NF038122 family metalloprotease [Bryobacterales bacterium]
MRINRLFPGSLALAFLCLAPANAALIINPTFDTTITSDPNASTIMATINSAISDYAAAFTDPITVNIKFQLGGGLGSSSTWIGSISYAQFLTAITADKTTANDNLAVGSLPSQANNPVNGNSNVFLPWANLRALGFGVGATPDGFDGTITLNTSIMNLTRQSIDPSKYDLHAVVQHEIDEVLAIQSALNGSANGDPAPAGPASTLDLFRYDQNGNRSFSSALAAEAYFSINGGTTRLVRFNQQAGGDFSDFASSATPHVQDAYGTPGATPNLGVELTMLDILGYDLAASPVPEPSTAAFLVVGILAGACWKRRRPS